MARGDVLRVDLPWVTDGREQRGCRPAIAVQVETASLPTLLVIPATGNLAASRFPFTVRVEPTTENGLDFPSILLVFQLRAIDQNRIVTRLGVLEDKYLLEVDAAMRAVLGLT